MASLDRLRVVALPVPPGHAEAVASLGAGQPFTCVLADDPAERAALLQAVIDTVADLGTRFVHVGNPLRSPLTIERLFMQAVGPEAEVRLERDPATLARILAGPVGDETRLLVVVEQPETMDAEALALLRAMAGSFGQVEPRVQMLFAGPTAFAATLQPGAEPAQTPPEQVPMPAPRPATVTVAPSPLDERRVAVRPRRRRAPMAAALAVAALAAAAALVWQLEPVLLRRLGIPVPAAPGLHAETRPSPSLVAPAAASTVPPAGDTTALRREFDRFLDAREDAAGLSEARRGEMFAEFLERRRARSAASQSQSQSQ